MNHVLIVDDDADSAATMRELVGMDRFSVAVAHSLCDARRQMALQPPIGLSMAQAEELLIQATLKQCMYPKERPAAVLGISLKTLYNRLKGYTRAR